MGLLSRIRIDDSIDIFLYPPLSWLPTTVFFFKKYKV